MMPQEYEVVWSELNLHLRQIDTLRGLGAVLEELEDCQQCTGFIKDRLEGVKWYTLFHPDDPSHFFRLQFNPKRALRFAGSGKKAPPDNIEVVNDGCFLCRDNIIWQQNGKELGYALHVNAQDYYAWMNPFPLMETHAVIASKAHTAQEWSLVEHGQLEITRLINDLIELACRLPGFIGFYNGIDAGASIPLHTHFQFVKRSTDEPLMPLERAAHNFVPHHDAEFIVDNYPLEVVVWRGLHQTVANNAVDWILAWAERNHDRMEHLTANIIATVDPTMGEMTLYFAPRDRRRTRAMGMTGLVGGLDVMGEVVFCTEDEKRLLDEGVVDYFFVESVLASVHTSVEP